jgi:hypothetical protein
VISARRPVRLSYRPIKRSGQVLVWLSATRRLLRKVNAGMLGSRPHLGSRAGRSPGPDGPFRRFERDAAPGLSSGHSGWKSSTRTCPRLGPILVAKKIPPQCVCYGRGNV